MKVEYALSALIKYTKHKLRGGSILSRMNTFSEVNGDIDSSLKKQTKRIAIFVAYHSRDYLPLSNLNYIQSLLDSGFGIFYVHNGPLNKELIDSLSSVCEKVICRPNIGSDCGAWKDAYLYFRGKGFFKNIDWILFCNDSNLFLGGVNAQKFVSRFNQLLLGGRHELIALNKNYEANQHFQSFFLCVGRKVFESEEFNRFWNKYRPLDHRFYSINKCEIQLSKNVLSHYDSKIIYDSVQLYQSICDEGKVSSDKFLPLIPKNAMHLAIAMEGEKMKDFDVQKILAVLACHNPSHSLALLFVEYLKSPFLKKDLVVAGSYSLTQVQSVIKRNLDASSTELLQEILDLYLARGLNTSYLRRPRFSYRKGINSTQGMYLGGWGNSLQNMGFRNPD